MVVSAERAASATISDDDGGRAGPPALLLACSARDDGFVTPPTCGLFAGRLLAAVVVEVTMPRLMGAFGHVEVQSSGLPEKGVQKNLP